VEELNSWLQQTNKQTNKHMINTEHPMAKSLHTTQIKMQIITSNTIITNINSTKFQGLITDSTLSRKHHITGLTSKLNKACYAIRAIKPFMSLEVMKMIYYSYVHSVISYGIIFWGNSHFSDSIFKIKKIIIRVITNTSRRDSCCELYKKLQILPLPSQYIFSLLVLSTRTEVAVYLILTSQP
jgi:hypothetical protein